MKKFDMNKTQKNNIYVKEKSMMNQGNYNIEYCSIVFVLLIIIHEDILLELKI